MFAAKWNIGLDIHDNELYAIATVRRSSGWHLCGYWQKTLTNKSKKLDTLLQPDWIKPLKEWRKTLPRKLSLRIALPVQSVLQQSITLPNIKFNKHELDAYITSVITKIFPFPANQLYYDYSLFMRQKEQMLLITAARRSDIETWQDYLCKAQFYADIIEIVPNAIRYAAMCANCLPNMLLAHNINAHWLLISPLSKEYQYTLQPIQQCPLSDLIQQANKSLKLTSEPNINSILVSGKISPEWEPACYRSWSPFNAFVHSTKPLPTNVSMYVIACGLALREQDKL